MRRADTVGCRCCNPLAGAARCERCRKAAKLDADIRRIAAAIEQRDRDDQAKAQFMGRIVGPARG